LERGLNYLKEIGGDRKVRRYMGAHKLEDFVLNRSFWERVNTLFLKNIGTGISARVGSGSALLR
jgi:hypothetical protein